MIVLNQSYGQLCNQLFLFAHIISFAIESGQRVWVPGFYKKRELFNYFTNDRESFSEVVFFPDLRPGIAKLVEIGMRRAFHSDSKLLRLIERLLRKKTRLRLDYLTEACFPEFEGAEKVTSPICFFEGWMFRCPLGFSKHAEALRSIFAFLPEHVLAAEIFLSSLPFDKVVGVHIRQGDYAEMAPQWTYSVDRYLLWIQELRQQMGPGTCFVIVSDSEMPKFEEDYIVHHKGSAIQDLCVLAHCEFVMGPPSTFNRWACFMGNRNHLCLWNPSMNIDVSMFKKFRMLSDDLEIKTAPAFDRHDPANEELCFFGIY